MDPKYYPLKVFIDWCFVLLGTIFTFFERKLFPENATEAE